MSKSIKEKLREAMLSGKVKDEQTLRVWLLINELSDKIDEEIPNLKLLMEKIKGEKGDPGYTPVKGKDYFDGYTPKKGKDYFDGKDGYTPRKGKDYFDGKDADEKEVVKQVLSKIKIPKPETVDEESIIKKTLERVKIPEPFVLSGEEVVNEINKLPVTEDKQIDAAHIKNLPEVIGRGGGFGIREAPKDGKTYGRKDRDWVEVTSEESDTLQTVTDRGATTTNESTFSGGIKTTQVQASTSAGIAIKADNEDTAVLIGAGGGKNATFYDGVKLDAGTASRVLVTDANKNITQATMTAVALDAIPTTYVPYSNATDDVNLLSTARNLTALSFGLGRSVSSTARMVGSVDSTFTRLLYGTGDLATRKIIETNLTGDTNFRFDIEMGGKLDWGAGNTAMDTNLYRDTANSLKTDDDFTANKFTKIGGTSSQFLKADGSVDESVYVTGTPWTSEGYLTEIVDDTTPQLGGDLDTNLKSTLHASSGMADNTAVGDIITDIVAGESIAFPNLVYLKSDGKWWKVVNTAVASCQGLIGIALESKSADQACRVLTKGFIRDDDWTWTVGSPIFAGTAGALTHTAPTAEDSVTLLTGVATHADRMWFNPQTIPLEYKA